MILIFLSIIWGLSFLLIKKVLRVFPPFELGMARVFIAGLTLLPWIFIKYKWHTLKENTFMVISGFTGYLIPALVYSVVGLHLNSSLAGTLNSTTPIFTLVIGAILFGTKIRVFQIFGIFFGFFGSLILILSGNDGDLNFDNPYALLAVSATILYGINTNIIGTYLKNVKPVKIAAISLFSVGIIAFFYLFFTPFFSRLVNPENTTEVLYLFILGVINTGIATVIFNYLLQLTSAVFGSSVTYLIPVVATLAGFMDGEIISFWHLFGMAIIFFGIYLLNKKEKAIKN